MSLALTSFSFSKLKSLSQVARRVWQAQYMKVLKRNMMMKRNCDPKYPIAYPIGIISIPSPKEADIIAFAVLEGVILKPYSGEMARNRAYIEAMNIPEVNTPTYDTNVQYPRHCRTKSTKVLPTSPRIKRFSLSVTVPGMYSKMIRKAVLVIQKIELRTPACLTSATPILIAYVGIQLARPTSSAIQKVKRMQMQIYAFLLSSKATALFLTSSRASGDFRRATGMKVKNMRTPMAIIPFSSKQMASMGPSSPPTPKTVWMSWIQKSWRSPMNILKIQRLATMLIMQLAAAAMNIQTERLMKVRERELRMREMLIMRTRATMIWWQLYILTRGLTATPPATQPAALAMKIKAQQVSSQPVTLVKKGMTGPTAVTNAPQTTQMQAQLMKQRYLCSMLSIIIDEKTLIDSPEDHFINQLITQQHKYIHSYALLVSSLYASRFRKPDILFKQRMQTTTTTSTTQLKDYYKVLNVPRTATTFQIQQAYEKLVNQWHPELNKNNKEVAQQKFNEINEAFDVLYNRSNRTHYDQIFQKGYSLNDAESTFNKFFEDHDYINEDEKQFFSKVSPQKEVEIKRDYYSTLGISKNSTLEEIKKAYRAQALKYHPKNSGNSVQAQKKFVEINQAYQFLTNEKKKSTHQKIVSRMEDPFKKFDTFEDFFGHKAFQFPKEDDFFKPVLKKKWSRVLDRIMDDDFDFGGVSNGETVKESTVYNNDNGVETKKTVKTKVKVTNGVPEETTVEIYEFPNGERDITRMIKRGNAQEKSQFHLKGGETLPKELTL